MSTRRTFLSLTAAATAAAAFPKRLFAEQRGTEIFTNASMGAYTQGLLTQANFEKHLGEVFTAFHSNGDVTYLTLRKVEAIVPVTAAKTPTSAAMPLVSRIRTPAASTVTSFFVTFSARGTAITQDSLLLDHGTMGRFAALVVPGVSTSGETTAGVTFTYLASAVGQRPQDILRTATMSVTR